MSGLPRWPSLSMISWCHLTICWKEYFLNPYHSSNQTAKSHQNRYRTSITSISQSSPYPSTTITISSAWMPKPGQSWWRWHPDPWWAPSPPPHAGAASHPNALRLRPTSSGRCSLRLCRMEGGHSTYSMTGRMVGKVYRFLASKSQGKSHGRDFSSKACSLTSSSALWAVCLAKQVSPSSLPPWGQPPETCPVEQSHKHANKLALGILFALGSFDHLIPVCISMPYVHTYTSICYFSH